MANKLVAEPPECEIEEIEDFVDKQFRNFRNFEFVNYIPSDHHFAANPPADPGAGFVCMNYFINRTPAADELARKERIRQEWELLKTRLPNSIFVRAYPTRPDFLRAAIIGLQNSTGSNPYGYGLFFFDIMLPSQYPAKPPLVHHVFRGVSLEANGFVNRVGSTRLIPCLGYESDSGEWRWDPEGSSLVEALGFIQRHVLGSGERLKGERCNEVFMLSHRAMANTMRNPPKGFEEFVKGYFRKYSHAILMQLMGHLEDEGFRKSSGVGQGFMGKLTFDRLVKEFEDNGSYCRHLLPDQRRLGKDY